MAVAERQFIWKDISLARGLKQSLGKNQIHIWMVNLRNLLGPGLTSTYANRLTESEIKRARRIVSDSHRQLYLGGRMGLRILLSGYTGVSNTDLKFGYGSRGKPKLINSENGGKLEFNYTLSRGYALYGFSRDREVGVDIELFPRNIDVDGFARRILTGEEKICWDRIPKEQHNDAMLACWTRKEAYGKALGVGIRYAMNQVKLFQNIQQNQWSTPVSGLFENCDTFNSAQLHGIQLGLPIPGVASLMYTKNRGRSDATDSNLESINNGDQPGESDPGLCAFQLHS